jgi:two-component system, NarL family, sensor histidine kinase UhpB
MKFIKSLQGRILIVFICFTAAYTGFMYFLFPGFGIKLLKIHSGSFVFIVTMFTTGSASLIYFYTRKFNKKIQKEKGATNEIIHRYDAISAATNDAIWDHDLIKGDTFYNERLRHIFGYSKDELRDNTSWWEDNIHTDDRERVISKMDGILQSDVIVWNDEYRFRCKDGSYKIVYDRSYIVRDTDGKPLRLIGAMNDVTENRQLQEKIVQDQLDHKNKLGKAIIMAHEQERERLREELHEDVNQALASVKLYVHSMADETEKNKEVAEQSIHQLNDVIGKIKKIADDLTPPGLEYFGLQPAIKTLVADTETVYPVSINLRNEAFDETNINSSLRIFIYRILQEYFQNIFLLPNPPTEINVELRNKGTKIFLSISDNCCPLETKHELKEKQFKGIRNRLEMYNGQMHVTTGADQNAVLEISF